VVGETLFVGVEAQDLMLKPGQVVVMTETGTYGGEEQRLS
jgi:hypothetical protein